MAWGLQLSHNVLSTIGQWRGSAGRDGEYSIPSSTSKQMMNCRRRYRGCWSPWSPAPATRKNHKILGRARCLSRRPGFAVRNGPPEPGPVSPVSPVSHAAGCDGEKPTRSLLGVPLPSLVTDFRKRPSALPRRGRTLLGEESLCPCTGVQTRPRREEWRLTWGGAHGYDPSNLRFAPSNTRNANMACHCLRLAVFYDVWALAAPRDAAREPGSRGLYHLARVGTNLRLAPVISPRGGRMPLSSRLPCARLPACPGK